MTTPDLLITLQWWVTLFLLGIIFLPVTHLLFPNFIDKGYAFTKTVGILFLSYLMLVLGITHILPFRFVSLLIILLLSLIFMYLGMRKYRPQVKLKELFLPPLRYAVIEEIFFIAIFGLWSYIRAFAPDINGLEKFMDFGFVNSILRSTYFPPKDIWFTPFSINYYYFGHLATAVLTKLSLLSSNYTFNLMIATLAGLTFIGSFSIGINLFQKVSLKISAFKYIVIGLLCAFLVTFAGNLHTLYALFKPYDTEHPVPFWQLQFAPSSFPNSYWYPNATRFIYHTIHEFPIYSWTVSDLHGHVSDIPFVLLTIAFLYTLFLTDRTKREDSTKKKLSRFRTYLSKITNELPFSLTQTIFLSLLLGTMYMTNAWDGIIYLLLAILLVAFLKWSEINKIKGNILTKLLALVADLVIPTIILGVGFFVFSLPLSLFFKPFVSGIGILCAPQFLTNIGHLGPFLFEPNHCQRSPWWQLLILYGFFLWFIILFGIALAKIKRITKSDIFVLLLIILSIILIIVPEFIYAKDIYPEHYRANTMFKLVFQSFIMLALSCGYIISRLSSAIKSKRSFAGGVLYSLFFLSTLVFLAIVFIFPYFSIMSYYGDLKTYKGLNGTNYLNDKYPSDAKAIVWLNSHVTGQPVILEAQGDSYTDYARVSANTGLPTVLGWTVHEWLWRGTYDIPAPRIDEVKTMYESTDINKTKALLNKYHVKYVFVGTLEREKYAVYEAKFGQLGKVVYQNGDTRIYQLF